MLVRRPLGIVVVQQSIVCDDARGVEVKIHRVVEVPFEQIVFDQPAAGWNKLPKQDFQRRALAAAAWQGKLAALGGMDQDADTSRRVDFFDPATGQWSQGPELPGTGMSGFGVSAWSLGEDLYVSGFNGRVFKHSADGKKWDVVAKLVQPRFFHQLVPAAKDDALLVLGGASRDGHLDDVELIDVSAAAIKKAGVTADDSDQAADSGSYHHHHHGHGAGGEGHAHAHAHADES